MVSESMRTCSVTARRARLPGEDESPASHRRPRCDVSGFGALTGQPSGLSLYFGNYGPAPSGQRYPTVGPSPGEADKVVGQVPQGTG